MERIFYDINEERAKTAHEMMSFRDYKNGSKTEEYQHYVNKAYDLADAVAEERPEAAERVYRLAERYSKKMAENINKESAIGCMCPSVMISGTGNFPTKKKEKQVAAWERNHEEWKEIQNILKKMESIRYGKEIIKSGDEDAVGKLEKKLEELKATQERMKAANRAIRMKDTEKGNEKLREMGFSEMQINELRTPDFCGRLGFPDYALTNNNANIHRVEGRLRGLKAAKEKGTQKTECKFFKTVENTENMRLQLFFDDVPDAEVRAVLKKNGFKWAPSQKAWQRQLTNNARWALDRVMEELESMEKVAE